MVSKIAIFGLAGGSVVLGAAGALAFSSGSQNHPITYITAPVAVGDIESSVMATGTLEPSNIVDVGAQTSGQLQSLTVKIGDLVTKGEKIGQIDPILLNNAVKSAQNSLNTWATQKISSSAQLSVATAEANRQRSLVQLGVSPSSASEKADAALKSAQASISQMDALAANAQLTLDAAQANLEKANIRSPIDGIVAEVLINEGATINTNNQVQVVLRVAKMDLMTVRAQISEADVMKMTNGQPVYFTVLGEPDVRYYGKLRQLGFTPSTGELDPSKGSAVKSAIYYNALLDLPNTDGRLRPGMTAIVHVVLGEAKGALTIPAAALGKQLDKSRYMVQVQDAKGVISQREVTTGLTDKLNVQVKSGLKVGEKVVVGQALTNDPTAPKKSMFTLPDSLKT